MTLNEVADLIVSSEAEHLLHGNYVNRRGIRGYYVQVKSGNHWAKISVSHADRHSGRITVDELDAIDPATLLSAVIIPVSSIAAALKSSAAEETKISRYLNKTGVDGIWAEFYYDGSWYMISVSQIDIPAYATDAELEQIADEFLRQQGYVRKRRIG